MHAWNLQRIGEELQGWWKPSGSACLLVSLLLGAASVTAQPSLMVVNPADQSARDDERLRILRDELEKSETLVETLARRKAERLAVADTVAADEAEEQRIRTLSDIAGIRREIAAMRPSGEAPKAAPPASGSASYPAKATPPKPQPTAPWWDVYGKAGRGQTPAPVSYAQPPRPAAAHIDSTRRME
ncbi:MAG: hypothetical protein EOP82_32525 [Variovorax sp.]|nr:MAG: hypothetical protein EOP82_32525 [Variovorax sp.]